MAKQLCDRLQKQQKLFIQGYNLEVHDVMQVRNKQKPLQAIVTFGEIRTLLKEYRRTRKGMKDKRNRHGAVGKSSSE